MRKEKVVTGTDVDGELIWEEVERHDLGPDLTPEQQARVAVIQAEIGKLVEEATAIIQPTQDELEFAASGYADQRVWELAEILVDGWGKPFEALEARERIREDEHEGAQ